MNKQINFCLTPKIQNENCFNQKKTRILASGFKKYRSIMNFF